MSPQIGPVCRPRFDRLDALRGFAMVWMATFHLCFDLNLHGLLPTPQNFRLDPFWFNQRLGIVSLFLFCAGVGQAIAQQAGQETAVFFRRWVQVLGCALLVSATSWWMFPRSWIHFGVLHGMAAMLLVLWGLGRSLRRLYAGAWGGAGRFAPVGMLVLGGLALVAPRLAADPLFNQPWLHWTGLVTRLPITEDYVPVLPWIGVMLWGYALGLWLLAAEGEGRARGGVLQGQLPGALRPLAALGRWPLTFYMVHQPVWLGLIGLLVWWRGGAA